jgi:transposase-like protein
MAPILSGIVTLFQYLNVLKNEPETLRPERCPFCGKLHPWIHGSYPRKADRSCNGKESLNPIYIQRYFCSGCSRTCSVLPEAIPPKRWYLWQAQEAVLLLLLAGKNIYATAKEVMPSRHTISRWLARFVEQLHFHKDVLCNHRAASNKFL